MDGVGWLGTVVILSTLFGIPVLTVLMVASFVRRRGPERSWDEDDKG